MLATGASYALNSYAIVANIAVINIESWDSFAFLFYIVSKSKLRAQIVEELDNQIK